LSLRSYNFIEDLHVKKEAVVLCIRNIRIIYNIII
jgi:hypothetical protein